MLRRLQGDGRAEFSGGDNVAFAGSIFRDEDTKREAETAILVNKDGGDQGRSSRRGGFRRLVKEEQVGNLAAGVGLPKEVIEVLGGCELRVSGAQSAELRKMIGDTRAPTDDGDRGGRG